ncbi:MAG: hypothetical protein GX657_18185 [Chloroflexi bacterium]|nr:hypothetical protein [Chloroflexota bacterium]
MSAQGRAVVSGDPKARISAVLCPDVFREFFEKYRDNVVPAAAAAHDFLQDRGIAAKSIARCYDLIVQNGKAVGLIAEQSGKDRVLSPEHALEQLGQVTKVAPDHGAHAPSSAPHTGTDEEDQAPREALQRDKLPVSTPSLHIDVQIHIAADAKPEQIE